MFIFSRKKPEEVFTPRGAYNSRMYAPRADLEADFREKMRRNMHILVYGESGCGKSWFYRNYFENNNIHFTIVNLADVSRGNNLANEILRVVEGNGATSLTGYDEKKLAEIGIPTVAKGSLDHTNKYTIVQEDPLRKSIRKFRKEAGSRIAFIVLDNLERIFDKPNLMDELADLITLADDPDFLQQGIRLLIVGVPHSVRQYFQKTPSHRTISNRLVELLEVSRLAEDAASDFIVKGFQAELGYTIDAQQLEKIVNHILWVTDRIPQSLHEYCLELAILGESKYTIDVDMMNIADRKWLNGTLSSGYTAIESVLNERDTKLQRRNQVIYALGNGSANEFKSVQVESVVRAIFYDNDQAELIGGVGNALSELAEETETSTTPILRKTPKGDAYMFKDPIYRMAIRTMLRIDSNKKVEKLAMDVI
jgi:hypothetical protein